MIQMYLQYTSDGVTTIIDFQADGCRVIDPFRLQVAENADSAVVERFDVWFLGTQSQAEALNRAINQAFEQARNHPRDLESCWLYFALDDSDDAWRARVANGHAELTEQMLNQLRQNRLRLAVMIERDGAWSGPEAQIPLSNDNGADNTSGLTVFNCADGSGAAPNKRINYVEIAAGAVSGDVPALVRLEVQNALDEPDSISMVWVGHNVNSQPATYNGLLEAEDADKVIGADVPDTSCSGGVYVSHSLTVDDPLLLLEWTIAAADVDRMRGYFRAMARFALGSAVTQARFKLAVLTANGATLYETTFRVPSDNYGTSIRDLAVIKLPPWLPGLSGQASVKVRLYAQRIVGSSVPIDLDFLFLLPLDSYRQYESMTIGYLSRMVDDAIEGYVYVEDSLGTSKTGGVIPYSNPIRLLPGRLQRLYFFFHNTTILSAPVEQTARIKLFYRPRRLAL